MKDIQKLIEQLTDDEDFQAGLRIVIYEGLCSMRCSEDIDNGVVDEYGDAIGWNIGGDKWYDVYDMGVNKAYAALLKYNNKGEVIQTIFDEIELEDCLDGFREEAKDFVRNIFN